MEKIVANDWDPVAVELIEKNMAHNGLDKERFESK